MVFDALGILRGKYTTAVIDLEPSEVVAISETVNSDGAKCLDIRQTGAKGLAAVMVLPSTPTTYLDTLTAVIEASDALEGNWETIASFPVLNCYLRRVPASASVAAAVEADIGDTLTGGTTGDTGKIVHIDPALYALNGTGYITVAMDAAGDVFDDTSEAITSGGTFSGVVNGVAADAPATIQDAPGVHILRFATKKRYIRGKYTVSTGGNFGKAEVLLSTHAFQNL